MIRDAHSNYMVLFINMYEVHVHCLKFEKFIELSFISSSAPTVLEIFLHTGTGNILNYYPRLEEMCKVSDGERSKYEYEK